ncbi:MAG: hypothetical protein PHN49_01780 [Candidatus Omnitrophica bacterium]|nr:hypothetical protein [Candidatus Omnitrophota bacterium]MDD5670348.1 hypothetical protein [Candidatus Omnitrophota bacterium]
MTLLAKFGPFLVFLGILICLCSGVARFLGYWPMGEFEVRSLFVTGLGLMVTACAAKLYAKE